MGKCLQPRLLNNTLTSKGRNGEAGKGQGSEPREPRGTPSPGGRCVMKGPPLGPVEEDITWSHQVASEPKTA